MTSLLLTQLEDLVRTELGPAQLAAVRAVASEHQSGHDVPSKAMAFCAALAQLRESTLRETCAWAGDSIVPAVIKAFPILVRAKQGTLAVLLHFNQVAPAALDALLPGAMPPEFDVELLGLESVRLRFTGSDAVAGAVEGVVLGCGRHFRERVEVTWPPSALATAERRILDVEVRPEQRMTPAAPPAGVPERRWGNRTR